MSRKKNYNSLLYHFKMLGMIILFLGFPIAVIAGVYQQAKYQSNAQGIGAMPYSDLTRLSPPPGCYYAFNSRICPMAQSIACREGGNCFCPPVLVCPSITPPNVTINPSIPVPTISVTPPPGCYPIPIRCTTACPVNNPNCCPIRYFCPSGTPSPRPTCFPCVGSQCKSEFRWCLP